MTDKYREHHIRFWGLSTWITAVQWKKKTPKVSLEQCAASHVHSIHKQLYSQTEIQQHLTLIYLEKKLIGAFWCMV